MWKLSPDMMSRLNLLDGTDSTDTLPSSCVDRACQQAAMYPEMPGQQKTTDSIDLASKFF
jgi:hypothetical protein